MKTMKEARERLVRIMEDLESGKIDIKTAAEMHNGVGKIINTVRTQLEYSKLRKEKPEIMFMKCK